MKQNLLQLETNQFNLKSLLGDQDSSMQLVESTYDIINASRNLGKMVEN